MTAAAFISTLQRTVYEYGASQHTRLSSNTVYSAHPSAVQSGNNLFKCRGGYRVFNVTCHWCDHKWRFCLNQHHLDTIADGGWGAVGSSLRGFKG